MTYDDWRECVFGQSPGTDLTDQVARLRAMSDALYELRPEESLDHIDRALDDPEIHTRYTKEQIGSGLTYIFNNGLSDLPFCYLEAGDEARRVRAIRNLKKLYDHFFARHCFGPVRNIGNDNTDGEMGYICHMLWDTFVLYPGNASPAEIDAALDVLRYALHLSHDPCIVSALHGLGHWVIYDPRPAQIIDDWLRAPTTANPEVLSYARAAKTGCIL